MKFLSASSQNQSGLCRHKLKYVRFCVTVIPIAALISVHLIAWKPRTPRNSIENTKLLLVVGMDKVQFASIPFTSSINAEILTWSRTYYMPDFRFKQVMTCSFRTCVCLC